MDVEVKMHGAKPACVDVRSLIQQALPEVLQRTGMAELYRAPLVGFAKACDPRFAGLKTLIDPTHLLPSDLLPAAKTVVAIFLPFNADLVRVNQVGSLATQGWALAKKDTDDVIHALISGLGDRLVPLGITCSDNPAREPYDEARCLHRWSQKHVAHICGLGQFGLNHLLITEQGCAGRLGSFCVDADVVPDPPRLEEACLFKINGSCGLCVKQCPSQALAHDGLDKAACSAWLRAFANTHFGGQHAYRACGKCIALPCALKRPRA